MHTVYRLASDIFSFDKNTWLTHNEHMLAFCLPFRQPRGLESVFCNSNSPSPPLITITLPFPVSVNSAYGQAKGQQRFKSSAYKRWLSICPALPRMDISTPVHIEYTFYMPSVRDRDLSNHVKLAEDYLVSQGIIVDDNYNIVRSFACHFGGIDRSNGRVEIAIYAK